MSATALHKASGDGTANGRTSPAASAPPSGRLALTARQSLMWLDQQLFPAAGYHQLVLTLALHGPLDRVRFARAWAATVSAHDGLRMTLELQDPA